MELHIWCIYLQNFSSWKWKSNISSPIRWKISEKLVSELISTLKILFGIISYLILLHKTQSSTQNRKVYHKASSLKNPSIYKLMENLLIALALAEQTNKKACIHFSGPPFFILKIWLKIEILSLSAQRDRCKQQNLHGQFAEKGKNN